MSRNKNYFKTWLIIGICLIVMLLCIAFLLLPIILSIFYGNWFYCALYIVWAIPSFLAVIFSSSIISILLEL
jgi:hypothetical protein